MSRRGGQAGAVIPVAAVVFLWGIAFSMACRFAGEPLGSGEKEPHSFMDRFLGASQVAFGDSLVTEADDYFHKGVGHTTKKAFTNDLFQRWDNALRPSGHVHRQGVGVQEIMPWLRFATEMDPHNVEAYLTTAFWLVDSVKRPDIAETVLMEATRNNPGNYRILNERAKLLFGRKEDAKASALLDAAIRLWPSNEDPKDRQTQLDLAQMLSYRGFLYEFSGDRDNALKTFQLASEVFPENEALKKRVLDLENNRHSIDLDRQVWERIFARKMVCTREDHHDHDDGEEDDHDHGAE